jgi:hypothetical protein
MFGSSSPPALGYANSALMIALIKELRATNVLTPEGAENVYRNGIGLLAPFEHVGSIKEAIAIISNGIKANVAKG